MNLLVLFFSLIYVAQAQSPGPTLKPRLDQQIANILKRARIPHSHLSFSIVDVKNQKTIRSWRGDSNTVLASVTKILTCLYAFEKLDPEERFETKLFATGKKNGGIWSGDFFLRGGGDPLLTSSRLMDFVINLKKRGINKISGGLYYDEGPTQSIFRIADLGLGDQTYNPSISSLSLDFNRFTIFKNNKDFFPSPPLKALKINIVKERFLPGQNFKWITNSPETWALSHKKRYQRKEDIPVRNASQYTANQFAFLASFHGYSFNEVKQKKTPADASLLFKKKGSTILNVCRLAMEYSNNMLAEQVLLKSFDKAFKKKDRSLETAARDMKKFFIKKYPKLSFEGSDFVNGSGLTSNNKIKPNVLASILAKNLYNIYESNSFLSLFSIGSHNGWLKNRFVKPESSFRVWAKSGSLDYINNLAGYLFIPRQQAYSFHISISDEEKRKRIDLKNDSYSYELSRQASGYKKRAIQAMDDIIELMINRLSRKANSESE